MARQITTTELSDANLERDHLVEDARGYAAASKADNTRRAYRSDWESFTTWCRLRTIQQNAFGV